MGVKGQGDHKEMEDVSKGRSLAVVKEESVSEGDGVSMSAVLEV